MYTMYMYVYVSFTRREVKSLGTRFLHELVNQSDVGKRPSRHDGIVATASPVGIKFSWSQPTVINEEN